MENFLSEIKSKANKVAKKSGEFFELSKIKLNIANTKSDISSQFKLLGEMVYVAHRDSIEVDAEKFEEIIAQIDALYAKCDELSESAAGLSNKKLCPECEKTNDINASFCSGCGYRYPETEEE